MPTVRCGVRSPCASDLGPLLWRKLRKSSPGWFGAQRVCGRWWCILYPLRRLLCQPERLITYVRAWSWQSVGCAGIQTVIVRPPSDATTTSGSAVHMTLFAIAGGLQGTHVSLEMRSGGHRLAADQMLPFEKNFWAAPIPHAQPGLIALAATLTKLEVCTQQDKHLRSRMCSVTHYLQVQTCCTACCAGQIQNICPKTGQLALPMLTYAAGGGDTMAGHVLDEHRGGRCVGGVRGPACAEASDDWVRVHVSSTAFSC